MDRLGIHSADLGLPGAGPRAVGDVTRLAQEIVDEKLSIVPGAAGRTHVNDIRPMVQISQKVGVPHEGLAFHGSSPVRVYAENWDLALLPRMTADAIQLHGE